MNESKPQPVEFKLKRKLQLELRWSDGRSGVIRLDRLRRECPCAGCRQVRTERAGNPLAVITADVDGTAMTTVEHAELAGNYGLKITWKDGHSTGIYDFDLLRRLST